MAWGSSVRFPVCATPMHPCSAVPAVDMHTLQKLLNHKSPQIKILTEVSTALGF